MSEAPQLPTEALPHVAMDFARLRAEGIALLERLASRQWTDFNSHDPGITILEQVCYALTDLGYRTAFSVPDLLAGGPSHGLAPADAALTCDPVTLGDTRRKLVAIEGVRNAWVDAKPTTALPLYFHAASGELRFRPEPGEPDTESVRVSGARRLAVQAEETASQEEVLARVNARMHGARLLCEDAEVVALSVFRVWVWLQIEIAQTEDPANLVADIVERLAEAFAPTPRFDSVADARARGIPNEEIYEGPLLPDGYLSELRDPPKVIYASDVVHVVSDLPAVRAVRSIELSESREGPRQRWALPVPEGAGVQLGAVDTFVLFRDGVMISVSKADVESRLAAMRREPGQPAADPVVPVPRPRALGEHSSLQYQLPAAYGVGEMGLPASATPLRKAQARQLEGYLLFFDQLIANAFAQLAHARDLLSPNDESTVTYFSSPVLDERLQVSELLTLGADDYRAWLARAVDTGDSLERRKQLLGHLLARFAEQAGEQSLVAPGASPNDDIIADRRSFLRSFPRLSGGRGTGMNLLRTSGTSPFADRLRHKLGLARCPSFIVVEHLLLRPIPEDVAQARSAESEPEIPLLAGLSAPDPWSAQLTIVLRGKGDPTGADPYTRFVEQTILAEVPAHITTRVSWRDDDVTPDWTEVVDAWAAFRAALREARQVQGPAAPPLLLLQLRDARDRVIDVLEIGRTYPLRDIPLPDRVVATPGVAAFIPLGFSQQDVFYVLSNVDTGEPILIDGEVVRVDGTGGPIQIPTPAIVEDVSYRILAVKREGATTELRREAWLRTVVRLEESIDVRTIAIIRELAPLDPRLDRPVEPTDARIADWGAVVEVEIHESQEGVVYSLVEHADKMPPWDEQRVLSNGTATGTSGTVKLKTFPAAEDVDMRVRGYKLVGQPPARRDGVLDVILPLRVRANGAVPVRLSEQIVEHGASTTVKLSKPQATAAYRIWVAPVRDSAFVFDLAPPWPPFDDPSIDVGTGDDEVRIARPAGPGVWETLPGFVEASEEVPGAAGAIDFALAGIEADFVILLQATKKHYLKPDRQGEQIGSGVQAGAALAVLSRPDPQVALELAFVGSTEAGHDLLMRGGQPGVYYDVHNGDATEPLGQSAYFHQRDDRDESLNKGVAEAPREGLGVGLDFAISRGPSGGDPTRAAPLDPAVTLTVPADASVLRVSARKAMTRLTAPVDAVFEVLAKPKVRAPTSVEKGASATVDVTKSLPDVRYALLGPDEAELDARDGDGDTLELSTGALTSTTTFVVLAFKPGAVSWRVALTIKVGEG